MKTIQFVIKQFPLLFFIIIFISTTAHGQTESVEIEVGKDQVLKVDFTVEKAVSGNPAICRPEMKSGQEVLIRGLQPGETNIHVFGTGTNRKEFSVVVADTPISQQARELSQILGKIQKVKVDVVGRKILVTARVYNSRDFERVKRMVEIYPDVIPDIDYHDVYWKIIAKEIKTVLKNYGIKEIKVTPMHDNFIVEGHAPTQEVIERVGALMKALHPKTVNALRVANVPDPIPALIKMNMKIMEVEKNALRDHGIHWNPLGTMTASGSYSGSSGESATLAGAITTFISNLFPKMRKIEEEGRGRTVFNQDILVRSGAQGKFFRGKEVPFLVAQRDGIMSTEFKKIGVTLQCTPVLVSNKDISTAFKIEASRITGQGPGGAPVIATNDMNTEVVIPIGQSIALGGAMGRMELKLLSNSPPDKGYSLFQLNKAGRNEMQNSEVIILVTPKVYGSSQEAADDLQNSPEERIKQQELEYMRSQLKNNQ